MMCSSCPAALRVIFHTAMARCSLFVLKVPLNASQLTISFDSYYTSKVVEVFQGTEAMSFLTPSVTRVVNST